MIKNIVLVLGLFLFGTVQAQESADSLWKDENFANLKMRSIGPAFMSGRIADVAIHPADESVWYVAVGSGGVWKTENNGTTWNPIFDDQTSYSTGCITIDPNNHSTIWLGTGENVGGRHVGYGDGVYRSMDGGETWKNMGLKESEHISKIIVHPTNSDIVWVASQGPLWTKGGERGVYKTTNGGETWTRTLGNDEWTGATDIVIDPRDPNRLYAATWDRHRTIAAYLGGGPGTGLHRSIDGGETWEELTNGLPKSNMGKIGLAISPQKPDVLYAAIELDHREGGVYKSVDRGSNWKKQSNTVSGATGPHYYQELYACPHNFDRLYLMDVRVQISDDGGKNFRRMKEQYKHSDNHAMAFKMSDPDYLLFGTDGGLYESFDLAENWRYISNLPITQFYKLAVDDAEPFYNVYGGTQDNNTQGGPSRTDNPHGIQNSDWKVVLTWDGHQPATEPGNPDIMYGQRQEGHLSRIDLSTGEVIDIQPQAAPGEKHERYNWDAPILVSPHSPTTIYHGSYRLWKSENRGDSWEAISEDLTRDENRLELPIMGRTQSYDNAWDLYAMSNYNTITSIAESPVQADLLYVGTDDGLIQVSENGGDEWRKIEVSSIPGVPGTAYVNNIIADLFDAKTVYVALDNHKYGDYKPYLVKSTDAGKTWTSIAGNLPDRHLVWRLVQDTEKPELLFIGTEYGIFFSQNSGNEWTKIKGGIPNIPVRDITIQRREDDLVAATFGRSFYIYDDIAVFREVDEENLKAEGALYSVRDAWWYIPRPDLSSGPGKGSQGNAHFVADNPPFGALFTYHLSEGYKTMEEIRKEKEKEYNEAGSDVPFPGWDKLAEEMTEQKTKVWLVVTDPGGNFVRKVPGQSSKGFHRVAWDLRYPTPAAVKLDTSKSSKGSGLLVPPGDYEVQLFKEDEGVMTALSDKETFTVKRLYEGAIKNPMADQRDAFWKDYSDMVRVADAVTGSMDMLEKRVAALNQAYERTPNTTAQMALDVKSVTENFNELKLAVEGNPARNKIGEKNPPTMSDRIFNLYISIWDNTYGPTERSMENLEIVKQDLGKYTEKINQIDQGITSLAKQIYDQGGPWIQGQEIPE